MHFRVIFSISVIFRLASFNLLIIDNWYIKLQLDTLQEENDNLLEKVIFSSL